MFLKQVSIDPFNMKTIRIQMVVWCVLLGSQLFFGFQLSRFCFGLVFSSVAILGLSVPTGIGLSSIAYFCTCWLVGHNNMHLLIHIGILIALSILLLMYNKDRSLGQFVVGDLFALCFLFVASYVIVSRSYPRSKTMSLLRTTIPYLYEEFAIKASFVYGANSGRFSPLSIKHPAQNGQKVRTRWLTAFHSSMLEMGFASERMSVVAPSLLYFVAFMALMYSIGLEFKIPRYLSCLCPFLVMFVAGYAFYDIRKSPDGSHQLDYVSRTRSKKTVLLHPMLHFFIGMRSTPFASAISAAVFLFALKTAKSSNLITEKPCVLLGALVGVVLPVLNPLAFVAISLFVWLSFLIQWRNCRMISVAFGISYAIGAFFHMRNLFQFVKSWKFDVYWHDYITTGYYFPFITFWFDCYGIFPFIVLTCSWFVVTGYERKVLIPLVLTFFILCQFQMHRTIGYSLIAFTFGFLPMASVLFVLVCYKLAKYHMFPEEIKGALTAFVLVLFGVTCVSGASGFIVQLSQVYEVWDSDDMSLGAWVRANTPSNAVFLTSFLKMPPETTFAGRTSYIAPKSIRDIVEFNSTDEWSEVEWFCMFTDNDEYLKSVSYFVKSKSDSDECRFVILNEETWKEVYDNSKVTVFQRVK